MTFVDIFLYISYSLSVIYLLNYYLLTYLLTYYVLLVIQISDHDADPVILRSFYYTDKGRIVRILPRSAALTEVYTLRVLLVVMFSGVDHSVVNMSSRSVRSISHQTVSGTSKK